MPSALETCAIETSRVFGPKQLFVLVEQHLARVIDRRNAQPRALFRAQHLPGNDVGVMLHPGDDNLIVLLNVLASPTLRDKIDGLGRSAHKDDLARGAGIQKAARLFASRFVGIGGTRGQFMRGAMHIGVLVFVEVAEPINDRLRLLRGRAVVQPDQRTAIDPLTQNRKIAANRLHVEGIRREAEIAQQLRLAFAGNDCRNNIRSIERTRLSSDCATQARENPARA